MYGPNQNLPPPTHETASHSRRNFVFQSSAFALATQVWLIPGEASAIPISAPLFGFLGRTIFGGLVRGVARSGVRLATRGARGSVRQNSNRAIKRMKQGGFTDNALIVSEEAITHFAGEAADSIYDQYLSNAVYHGAEITEGKNRKGEGCGSIATTHGVATIEPSEMRALDTITKRLKRYGMPNDKITGYGMPMIIDKEPTFDQYWNNTVSGRYLTAFGSLELDTKDMDTNAPYTRFIIEDGISGRRSEKTIAI